MQRALFLAAKGRGAVEPNPMVGAVIVHGSEVLGEGYHRRFGGPHAEVEALQAARQAGCDVAGATIYVTLEPCSHYGKTPPCVDAIIAAGLGRVVAAMQDPDEKVSGRGLAKLRDAGVEVVAGVCRGEAEELLAAYVKLRTSGRPWVICKWAQTADGYLALPSGRPSPGRTSQGQGRWISGEPARRRVHEVRSRCDGILVGVGTVLADDPRLDNRSGQGSQPARVVLDSRLRTPAGGQLVQTAADLPVIVATSAQAIEANPQAAEALRNAGVEILTIPTGPVFCPRKNVGCRGLRSGAEQPRIPTRRSGKAAARHDKSSTVQGGLSLEALLDEMGRRQWTYLLVEGGPEVLSSFITAGFADELLVFVSPQRIVPAESLPRFDLAEIPNRDDFKEVTAEKLGEDTLHRFVRYKGTSVSPLAKEMMK